MTRPEIESAPRVWVQAHHGPNCTTSAIPGRSAEMITEERLRQVTSLMDADIASAAPSTLELLDADLARASQPELASTGDNRLRDRNTAWSGQKPEASNDSSWAHDTSDDLHPNPASLESRTVAGALPPAPSDPLMMDPSLNSKKKQSKER
jgi:hypothetical protein